MTSSRAWSIVGLLCVAYIVAYFDRVNLSVALADDAFKKTFQLTNMDRGNLNSAFFWSYTLMQVPAGWIVDKYGVKYPYAFGFFVWSLVSAGTALSSTMTQLVGLRLLLGVGESVLTPAGMRWVRFNIPAKHLGLAVGLLMAAAKVGPAIGTPIAGLLLKNYGWQNMFVILGLGCLLWLVPWLMLVRNDDKSIELKEQAQNDKPPVSFRRALLNPVMIGTIIGTFCYQYFVYYCLTWLPAYFKEQRHLDLAQSTWFTGFSFGGMAIVATLSGFWADRLIERGGDPVVIRKRFIYAGFLVACTEIFGAYAPSMEQALFFSILSLSGLGLMTANYWALTQELLKNAAVGRLVGVQNAAANLPGVVAPILTGWLLQTTGSYTAPMQAIWFFLIVGIAAYYFLVRREYVPMEAR